MTAGSSTLYSEASILCKCREASIMGLILTFIVKAEQNSSHFRTESACYVYGNFCWITFLLCNDNVTIKTHWIFLRAESLLLSKLVPNIYYHILPPIYIVILSSQKPNMPQKSKSLNKWKEKKKNVRASAYIFNKPLPSWGE